MKGIKNSKENTVEISFTINGKKIKKQIKSSLLLIDLVREELGLTGTKYGCNEGECGACSVLVNGTAINSCLYPAINVDGKNLTTVEGLSNEKEMDIVQAAMVEKGAVQCGFCSPGMAISIKSLQNYYGKKKRKPGREELKKGLEGNLCRCTGYVKIIEAAEAVLTK